MTKGQRQFNFATDLESLLNAGPNHLTMMDRGYGGFSWWHHLGAFMVLGCLSDLEIKLGKSSWKKYDVHVDEFESLKCMRNAYVHSGSDLSKINDQLGLKKVSDFLKRLEAGEIYGVRGPNQKIDPYYSLTGPIVEFKGNTIRRMRSLYLQVIMEAGEMTFPES